MAAAPRSRTDARWHEPILALLIVVVLHVLLAAWLIHFPPAGSWTPPVFATTRITTRFIARPPPPTDSAVLPRQRARVSATLAQASSRIESHARRAPATSAQPAVTATATGSAGLNLHVPEAAPTIVAGTQRILMPADALQLTPTRFANDWAPDDGEIQQTWAFRSRLAGAALSMTGALRKPCTQRERDQRLQHCFGKQYRGDVAPPSVAID